VSALPKTPAIDLIKNSNENACKKACFDNTLCIEATFVDGQCSLFSNVVLTRGAIQGAIYFLRDRGDVFTDCVGQELYNDMCQSKAAGHTSCAKWVGDGTCDNGLTLSDSFHQIFLNCHKFQYDGGDCKKGGGNGKPDAGECFDKFYEAYEDQQCEAGKNGVIEDCWGQVFSDADCAVAKLGITKCSQWIGDESCDGGQNSSDKGYLINFNCEEHKYDGGDCDDPHPDTPSPTPGVTPAPTDKVTPQPTPKPTDAPTDTPKPTPEAPQPTPNPTPFPTDRPTDSTPRPTPETTPAPQEIPTPRPPPLQTPSPTKEGETPKPTPFPTPAAQKDKSKYVKNGKCVRILSNKDVKEDFKGLKGNAYEAQLDAAGALDGKFYEINNPVWDDSSMILCNKDKKLFQSNTPGQTEDETRAVVCYGNPQILKKDRLYAIYNKGSGAELYGEFQADNKMDCTNVKWDRQSREQCETLCEDKTCVNAAKAVKMVPCTDQPPTPPPTPSTTPAPTGPPTFPYTDGGLCVKVVTNADDDSLSADDEALAAAMAGEYEEIKEPYDSTSYALCEGGDDMIVLQSKTATGGFNPVLCRGAKGMGLNKKAYYVVFNTGKTDKKGKPVAELYGRFEKDCNDVQYIKEDEKNCKSLCKDSKDDSEGCNNAVRATEITICERHETPAPTPVPTPKPTPAPTKKGGEETPAPTKGVDFDPCSDIKKMKKDQLLELKPKYDKRIQNTFDSKNCAKMAGSWKKGACTPALKYSGKDKTGKVKCKKFNEVSCTCIPGCKGKFKKSRSRGGAKEKKFKKCKGKGMFDKKKHGDGL